MLNEYLHRGDRNDDKLLEYGDLVGNGALFKRLGYLLKRASPPADALIEACRARRTTGINDLNPSAKASGPILSAWGIRLNADLDRTSPDRRDQPAPPPLPGDRAGAARRHHREGLCAQRAYPSRRSSPLPSAAVAPKPKRTSTTCWPINCQPYHPSTTTGRV